MALSAALSTTAPSTVPAGYVINCVVTITNTAMNSITVQDIEPAIKSTPISFAEDRSSWTASPVSLVNNPVPASGSQQFLLRVIFHGANNLGSYDVQSPNMVTYDLGCIVYMANGSVLVPTPLTLTVTQNSQEI